LVDLAFLLAGIATVDAPAELGCLQIQVTLAELAMGAEESADEVADGAVHQRPGDASDDGLTPVL
jgi:hypothetical protein